MNCTQKELRNQNHAMLRLVQRKRENSKIGNKPNNLSLVKIDSNLLKQSMSLKSNVNEDSNMKKRKLTRLSLYDRSMR